MQQHPNDSEDGANPTAPRSVSRRDFLRRASKQAVTEAVETGSKLVPGVGVAKTVLGGQGKPSLLQRLVEWRAGKEEGGNPHPPRPLSHVAGEGESEGHSVEEDSRS